MTKELEGYKSKWISPSGNFIYKNTVAVKAGIAYLGFCNNNKVLRHITDLSFVTMMAFMVAGIIAGFTILPVWVGFFFSALLTLMVLLTVCFKVTDNVIFSNFRKFSYATPRTRVLSALLRYESNEFFDALVDNYENLPDNFDLPGIYHLWVEASEIGGTVGTEVRSALTSIGSALPTVDYEATEINELVKKLIVKVRNYKKSMNAIDAEISNSEITTGNNNHEAIADLLRTSIQNIEEESQIADAVVEELRNRNL